MIISNLSNLLESYVAWQRRSHCSECRRPSCVADFGGNWNNGSNVGAFNRNLNNAPSNANDNVGSRLFRAAEIFFSVALTVRKARLGLNMQRVESDRNAPTRNKQNEKKIK